jgi:vesicle-associated membrane protein 7
VFSIAEQRFIKSLSFWRGSDQILSQNPIGMIDYCAIFRGSVVIASYGDNSSVSERDIVKLLPPSTSRTQQKIASGKLFTFVTTPGLTFACISQASVDKQRPIVFLDTLSRRWAAQFGPVSASSTPHGLDGIFNKHFAALFNEFSNTSKTSRLSMELEETQDILKQSMTKALDRGSELDTISAKSEDLLVTSEEFRAQATNLKWRMRCQYIRSWITWILIVVLIAYFIASRFCGGFTLKTCRASPPTK